MLRRFGAVLSLAVLLCSAAHTQTPTQGVFTDSFRRFGTIASTGVVGQPFSLTPASTYTLDWSFTGTAPTACTLRAEGSSDGVHWFDLTGAQDCTTAQMIHVANKPVLYLRMWVLTYTPGDGSTAVSVRYTRGG